MNSALNKYASVKKVNNYKLKLKKTLGWFLVFKNQSILKANYKKSSKRESTSKDCFSGRV